MTLLITWILLYQFEWSGIWYAISLVVWLLHHIYFITLKGLSDERS